MQGRTLTLPRMSHSRYADLAACGELYRLKRIEKVPVTGSIYSAAGTAFHEWTDMYDTTPPWDTEISHEDWYRDRLLKEITALEEKTGFAFREWDNPQFKADANERARDKFINETGPDMIRKYIDWRASTAWSIADLGTCTTCGGAGFVEPVDNPPEDCPRCDRTGKCLGIECEFTPTIHGVEFIVKIDRIFERPEEGDLVIVDTKTWSKKRVTAQLPTYVVSTRMSGFNVTGAGYYHARKGEASKIEGYRYWDENRLAALYTQAAHMISEGWFLPRPSDDCSMCDVSRHCSFFLG